MKASGRMTRSSVEAMNCIQMAMFILGSLSMADLKVKELIFGLMERCIMVTGPME